uniref:Uncharacterized protein n=1 Tax=Rhizophora mucronata TaxID=61149 RepID=A0A2P2QQW2_RHIMU
MPITNEMVLTTKVNKSFTSKYTCFKVQIAIPSSI